MKYSMIIFVSLQNPGYLSSYSFDDDDLDFLFNLYFPSRLDRIVVRKVSGNYYRLYGLFADDDIVTNLDVDR